MEGLLPPSADDEQIERLLSEHVRPGMTVADVGAHAGRYVLMMAELVGPDGRVHAVEPNPPAAAQLASNVALMPNVAVHLCAGMDVDGRIGLWRNPENAGDSRVWGNGEPELTVRACRLSRLMPRLDFALLDCQGTEHLALRGLARRRPPVAVVEVWPEGIIGQGLSPEAVLREYERMGYEVTLLDEVCRGWRNALLRRS